MKALVISSALLLAVGCAPQPPRNGERPASTGAKPFSANSNVRYECYTYIDRNHVLTLPVAPLNSEFATVTVTFHGDRVEATYVRQGLAQYWLFEEHIYVKLDPDYTAGYYDFTGAAEGELRKPEAVFECTKRRG